MAEEYEEYGAIVIDNGSFSMKSGFAGDDIPKCITSTKIGRPKNKNMFKKDRYIGDNIPNFNDFNINNPIENRIITNWDDIESIWHDLFYNQLKIAPEEHELLLTEAAYNSKSNHEKMEQIMFETFNIPGLHISIQQTLALYSYGRTTGYILDSGHKITDIVPIYEGYELPHAINTVKCGGYNVTSQLMNKYNIPFNSITDLKHKLFEQQQKTYKLPDGTEIVLDNKLQIECIDILFDNKYQIVKLFNDSVMKIDIDIRKDILNNICLCGGNFMLNGIDERLWNILDIKTKYGLDTKLINKNNTEMDRQYVIWLGGSILASLSTFESMFKSKDLYDEAGPSIVHRKCFGGSGGSNNIGFSVGGAKDIGNFRECIKNDIMPKESSITIEGIYYDYYFKTESKQDEKENEKEDKNGLFYPSYMYSISKIPNGLIDLENDEKENDNEYEYFMTIGLNSNLKESDFKRNKLNIVICLDISGSMSAAFNYNENIQKMVIANDSVIALLKHLNDYDRIGLVLFNTDVFIKQSLKFIKDINLNTFTKEIGNITANGGTDMEIGYKTAIGLYDGIDINNNEYDNRILYLTDAQPNYGTTNPQSLLGMIKNMSERNICKIYTTIIGVGLDFNNELVEQITNVNGANYYTVNSKDEFMKRMDNEFEFMVTPLVFNLKLNLKSEGNTCFIYKIYGSGSDNNDNNVIEKDIMNVNTLFPSNKNNNGETKGGMLLLQIKKNVNNDCNNLNMRVTVSYEDRNCNKYSNDTNVVFNDGNKINNNDMIDSGDYFDNNGIRKAVLLVRYVLLIKGWIKEMNVTNILDVNGKFKKMFSLFSKYFENEMKEIGDESLDKELKILQKLADF